MRWGSNGAARRGSWRIGSRSLPATTCTAHHIRPWKHGGRTRLANLVLLCFVHHHYFIHQQGWTLAGAADGTLRCSRPGSGLTLDRPLPGQTPSRSP